MAEIKTAECFEYILTPYQCESLKNRCNFHLRRHIKYTYCLVDYFCGAVDVINLRTGQVIPGSHQRSGHRQCTGQSCDRPKLIPHESHSRALWASEVLPESPVCFIHHDDHDKALVLYKLIDAESHSPSIISLWCCTLQEVNECLDKSHLKYSWESFHLVGYNDYLSCLIGNLFVQFVFPLGDEGKSLQLCNSFYVHAEDQSSHITAVVAVGNQVAILTKDLLSLYSMDGTLIFTKPLAEIVFEGREDKEITNFEVMNDLQTIILFSRWSAIFINLEGKLPQTSPHSGSTLTHSRAYGSIDPKQSLRWTKKIDFYHESVSPICIKSQKSQVLSDRLSNASAQGHHRVSGFKVRELQGAGSLDSSSCSGGSVSGSAKHNHFCISLPEEVTKLQLTRTCSTTSCVYAVYSDTRTGANSAVVLIDIADSSTIVHKLESASRVILSNSPTTPVQIMSEKGLHGLVFRHKQEALINKLILYETAAVADSLCNLNTWERCSIPVHALEIGLKHRQLDTVAFYLKSKENAFSLQKSSTHDDSNEEECVQQTHDDLHVNDLDLKHLKVTMDLLISTIGSHIIESQSKLFAEQLMSLTLEHLHKVLRSVVTKHQQVTQSGLATAEFENSIKQTLNILTDYIVQLRNFMFDMPHSSQHFFKDQTEMLDGGRFKGRGDIADYTPDAQLDTVLSEEQKKSIAVWNTLDEEAVIVQGLLGGDLPFLQTYLAHRFSRQKADVSHLVQVGLNEAFMLLNDRDMSAATRIIAYLGYDVASKLREICLFTPDRGLREYLASDLMKRGIMTEEEVEMIRFIHQVETLYSCPSFEMAKILRADQSQSDTGYTDLSAFMVASPSSLISQRSGDISNADVGNYETANYSNLLLKWTRDWDKQTRHKILLEQAIERKDHLFTQSISADVIWDYLCSHLDIKRLTQWIESFFPDTTEHQSVSVWPYNKHITGSMIDRLHSCPSYMTDLLLDHLARRGVFSPSEQRDIHCLIARLSRLSSTIQNPHLLTRRPDTHSLTLQDFHKHMMQYSIQHRQPELLYFYLDYCRLCLDTCDEVAMGQTEAVPAWVDMMLHFRRASRHITDPDFVFRASLSGSTLIQGMNRGSVTAMIEEGLVGRAVATLVFSPHQLMTFIQQPTEKARSALLALPRLHSVLFESSRECQTGGPLMQDITVYQLLVGNAVFDPSTLFGWQTTNSLATEGAVKELPHFSQEQLVKSYAHTETLDFAYYLKQGRPSFAFYAFIVSELGKGYKRIAVKSLQAVCGHTEWLAVKYFYVPHIAAACVAFIEMLGLDTFVARLHIQVARLILSHQLSIVTGSVEQQKEFKSTTEKEIGQLILACLQQSHSALDDITSLLQDAINWTVKKLRLKSCSYEAGMEWLLSVVFTRWHNLPVCRCFLRQCASNNDWLMFVTYAQLLQYSSLELREIVSLFPDRALREHLVLLLANIEPGDIRSPSLSPPAVSQPPPARDLRAQLYAKIGVTHGRLQTDGSSSSEESNTDVDDVTMVVMETESLLPLDFDNISHELIDVLYICEKEPLPWRSLCAACLRLKHPTLAVLAACYQNHEVVECLVCYILTSVQHSVSDSLKMKFDWQGRDWRCRDWTVTDVVDIFTLMIELDSLGYILTALKIFDPTCCLVPFLAFCQDTKQGKSLSQLERQLDDFLSTYQKGKASGSSGLFSLSTIESIIIKLIENLLMILDNAGVMAVFLQSLDKINLNRILPCKDVPNIACLHQMHQITSRSSIKLHYTALRRPQDDPEFLEECERVLNQLQEEHLFNEARLFAQVSGLPRDSITLFQLDYELMLLKDSKAWCEESARYSFWQHCQDTLHKHQVSLQTASLYIQGQTNECGGLEETGHLLQVAYDWLRHSDNASDDSQTTLFVKVWLNKIDQKLQKKTIHTLRTEHGLGLMCKDQLLDSRCVELRQTDTQEKLAEEILLSQDQLAALDGLLGELLDCGRIVDVLQVAETFHHHSQDLNIIQTILRLACGAIQASELDISTRQLLAGPAVSPRRRRTSSTLVSLPRLDSIVSLSSQVMGSNDLGDWVDAGVAGESAGATIQSLCNHCQRGQRCAVFISTLYSISLVLQQNFATVLQQDNIHVLHALLSCDAPNRLVLAKSFITGVGLNDTEVAGFLCDGIIESLKVQSGLTDGTFGRSFMLGSAFDVSKSRARSGITELIQLCDDSSVLGQRLLDAIVCLHSSNVELSKKMLSVEVELLIYTHDCFTLACHMDGISSLLRSARDVTAMLADAQEYNLMIHLLTGVARFNEMAYIFDILMERHQFELLFRKGIEKESKLRVAIFDYLQRYHPDDTDTHMMAALHFSMYRAIAQTLQSNAHNLITSLKGSTLENTHSTQKTLSTAVHYLSDAAESFCKEDCLRQGEKCVQLARLLALQIQLLPAKTRVINLDISEIKDFVISHPKFYEAYIVCEAYGNHSYWADGLYHHAIKAGNTKYLQDFRVYRHCTPALIAEVCQKCDNDGKQNKELMRNMKKLLMSSCGDVVKRYHLAQKLGLSDVIDELCQGETGAYLRDVNVIKD